VQKNAARATPGLMQLQATSWKGMSILYKHGLFTIILRAESLRGGDQKRNKRIVWARQSIVRLEGATEEVAVCFVRVIRR